MVNGPHLRENVPGTGSLHRRRGMTQVGDRRCDASCLSGHGNANNSRLGRPSMLGSEKGCPMLTRIFPVGLTTLANGCIRSVPVIPTGSTGAPDLSMRDTAPALASLRLAVRLRVPSGKTTNAESC